MVTRTDTLAPELELVTQLEATLAEASGHACEGFDVNAIDPVTGLPPRAR